MSYETPAAGMPPAGQTHPVTNRAARRCATAAAAVLGWAVAALPAAAAPVPPSAKSVSDEPGRLVSEPTAMLGGTLEFRGRFPHVAAGTRVILQRRASSGAWARVAAGALARGGRFALAWRTDRTGRFTMRAVAVPRHGARRRQHHAQAHTAVAGPAAPPTAVPAPRAEAVAPTAAPPAQDPVAAVTPFKPPAPKQKRRHAPRPRPLTRKVSVFAPSLASWYGPGLYGGLTACGMQLTPGLIGVAHRWLPCGTRIEFSYRGRSLVVPVIDRGPFASSASWDLTGAAAAQLGFHGVGSIGTLPAPSRAKVASAG